MRRSLLVGTVDRQLRWLCLEYNVCPLYILQCRTIDIVDVVFAGPFSCGLMGEALVVRIEGEGSSLYHAAEVPYAFECGQKFPVIRDPLLLFIRELGAVEGQWLPSVWTLLLEDATYRLVGGVGGDSQFGSWARVME